MDDNTPVVITNIQMPFWSVVGFMVKWSIAAIPAMVIVSLVVGMAAHLFYGLMLPVAEESVSPAFEESDLRAFEESVRPAIPELIRTDIRNAMSAQEDYFNDHRRYAPTLAELQQSVSFTPDLRVKINVIVGSETGYRVSGRYRANPEFLCTVSTGSAAIAGIEDGVISCTGGQ